MPGVCRDNDTAVGDLISSQSTVYANGEKIIVDGDSVANHGLPPHDAPTMTAVSNNVFIDNKAVCNEGDLATCGDAATGSTTVFVGD